MSFIHMGQQEHVPAVDVGNQSVGLKLHPSVKGTWHNAPLPPLLAVPLPTWRKSHWTIMWLMCEVHGFEL